MTYVVVLRASPSDSGRSYGESLLPLTSGTRIDSNLNLRFETSSHQPPLASFIMYMTSLVDNEGQDEKARLRFMHG
jgi:hypothetical protein